MEKPKKGLDKAIYKDQQATLDLLRSYRGVFMLGYKI
jgi:hypothetical protein